MTKKYNEIEVKEPKLDNKEEDIQESTESPKKNLTKITSAVPARKKNLFSRATTALLGEDGIKGLGHYVAEEIILPAAKNLIVDSVTTGINRLIYGEKGGPTGGYRPRSYSNYSATYRPQTNYTSRYTSQRQEPSRYDEQPRGRGVRGGVGEFVIENRNDAAHVLDQLVENADRYDTVSVADYYELIGVDSVYTDNNYGWTIDSITRAVVSPVRGGYIIKFPQTEVIS